MNSSFNVNLNIYLGIKEHKGLPIEQRFEITGVEDSYKIVTDFFNILNNKQKVSRSILIDSDVRIIDVEDKEIVYINVPEADYHKKPIFINNDLQGGTFKRTHEGDGHLEVWLTLPLFTDKADSKNDAEVLVNAPVNVGVNVGVKNSGK